jgi:hypothetical protein
MADADDEPARALPNGGIPKPVDELADRLRALRQEMGQQCADRAIHVVRETTAGIKDRRLHSGRDLFANCRSTNASIENPDAMKIKFKVNECVGVLLNENSMC